MATATLTDREQATLRFLKIDANAFLVSEGHLNAVADDSAARILAAGAADAPAPESIEARVEAAGLDVTGSAIEVSWFFDYPGTGAFPNGSILHNRLLEEADGYAKALDNSDYDYVGIGIALSRQPSSENRDAQVAVSVVFVDTDAIALVEGVGIDNYGFEIWGSTGSDEIIGTDGNDYILSGDIRVRETPFRGADLGVFDTGNDTIRAGDGDDTIRAIDSYADTLIGGDGDDYYSYLTSVGSSDYVPDTILEDVLDTIVEGVDGGIDTIAFNGEFSLEGYANVENLFASGVLIGNELDNTLLALDRTDTLDDDKIFDGKAGDDTMHGSSGSDLFIVDSANDVVTDDARRPQSYDVVRAYTSYVLPEGQEIEQLEMRRVRDVDGNVVRDVSATGNEFANRIIGNDQRNALNGLGGDDELIGRGGTDILTGGAGADVFRFAEWPGADGPDRITDFEFARDEVWLDAAALGVDLGGADRLSLSAVSEILRRGTEAQDADDRLLWDAQTRTAFVDLDGAGGDGAVALIAFGEQGDTPRVMDVWLV